MPLSYIHYSYIYITINNNETIFKPKIMKLTQSEEAELKRIEEKGALRKGVTTAEFHRSTELRMKKGGGLWVAAK